MDSFLTTCSACKAENPPNAEACLNCGYIEPKKVYISNFISHDYSDAAKYGEITPITKGYVSFGSLDRLVYRVAKAIKTSRVDDYLCLSGNNILSLIIGLMWYVKHKRINLLVWDKQAERQGRSSYRLWIINEEKIKTTLEQLS